MPFARHASVKWGTRWCSLHVKIHSVVGLGFASLAAALHRVFAPLVGSNVPVPTFDSIDCHLNNSDACRLDDSHVDGTARDRGHIRVLFSSAVADGCVRPGLVSELTCAKIYHYHNPPLTYVPTSLRSLSCANTWKYAEVKFWSPSARWFSCAGGKRTRRILATSTSAVVRGKCLKESLCGNASRNVKCGRKLPLRMTASTRVESMGGLAENNTNEWYQLILIILVDDRDAFWKHHPILVVTKR